MDKNQILSFIKDNIKISSSAREVLELSHFSDAIIAQQETLNRTPTPEQILRGWDNWRQERFDYIEHAKAHAADNAGRFESLAEAYVNKTETNINNNPTLVAEREVFKKSFAKQLCCLGKDPSEEHVSIAWTNWKKGFRW